MPTRFTTVFHPSPMVLKAESLVGATKPECTKRKRVPSSTLNPCPANHRIEARAIPDVRFVPALPGIDQALVLDHVEHLAGDAAIPFARRRILKRLIY